MSGIDLRKSAILGAMWKFIERMCSQFVSLVVSIVLARLLTPDDYSIVGIVSIFFVFSNVFITGGFNAALIRKKDADIEDYSSVLHISIFIAIVLYVILFFTAPFIADIYEIPLLTPVFRVMGLSLVVNAIKSVLCAYVYNQLQFKKFFFATLGGIISSAVVGIIMAMKGFGPWALVAQNMTNAVMDMVILFLTTKLKFHFMISWGRIKSLFDYGWKIFVSSIISAVYQEITPLIIGLRYSGADLSYYTKGKAYPSMLNTSISGTLSAVLFPVMSKVQEDSKAVLNYTRRFIRVSTFFVFPAMIGFMALSDNFICVLLTEKWLPAADYLKIFCLTTMFNTILDGNLQTIRAIGRSDIILKLEIIKKSAYMVVLVLAIIFSSSPYMLAMTTIVNTAIALIVNLFPNRKLIGYGYRQQLADILPNLIVSSLMGVLVYIMNYISINSILLLFIQLIGGMAIYVVLNILFKNPNYTYAKNVAKQMLSRRTKK